MLLLSAGFDPSFSFSKINKDSTSILEKNNYSLNAEVSYFTKNKIQFSTGLELDVLTSDFSKNGFSKRQHSKWL